MTLAPDDIEPPQTIAWLVELVGVAAALRLVEVHGGARVFVPAKVTAQSELAKSTGIAPAVLRKLCAARGGETIKLPICREWRVRRYRAAGESYSAIARRLVITQFTVWHILHRTDMTNQLELPLGP
jgi:DNA-binding NarL/FixJ family response regulator